MTPPPRKQSFNSHLKKFVAILRVVVVLVAVLLEELAPASVDALDRCRLALDLLAELDEQVYRVLLLLELVDLDRAQLLRFLPLDLLAKPYAWLAISLLSHRQVLVVGCPEARPAPRGSIQLRLVLLLREGSHLVLVAVGPSAAGLKKTTSS